MTEIADSNADLVCLQEVDHFEDFYNPELKKLGYHTLH
jgi:mRNA deadenylase 3'-5' endonuclease subunit Ccr4